MRGTQPSESPTQRYQRTVAARQALAARPPEVKRAHYQKMAHASNERRLVLPGDQADALREVAALQARIADLMASITKLDGRPPNGVADASDP